MTIKTSRLRLLLASVAIALLFLAGAVAAQSGRSWMNGFIFADSDIKGLPGAVVELIGDQNNDRLRAVRLSISA